MILLLKGKKRTMSNIVKEFETRLMLTESEYFEIVSHFMRLNPNKKFLKNVNVYFDTDDLYLKNNHSTLRVRIINDVKCELTLKISCSNGDDEINDYINHAQADALINNSVFPEGNVKSYLLTLPYHLESYKVITTLNNMRLEIENDDHLLVIDKNSYGDIIDYNLEIEANNSIEDAKKWMKVYMARFNLAVPTKKYVGKAHRAINAALNKD